MAASQQVSDSGDSQNMLPGQSTPFLDDDTPEGHLKRLIAGFQAEIPPPAPPPTNPASSLSAANTPPAVIPAPDAAPPISVPATPAPAVASAAPPPAISPALSPSAAPPIAAPNPSLSDTRLNGDQSEVNRLEDTGSGISQLQHKHPILGGIARVGEVLGSSLFPGIAVNVPGTSMHHNLLLTQARNKVGGDLANQQTQARTEQTQATTNALEESVPVTYNGVTYQVPKSQIGKIIPAAIAGQSRENVADTNAQGHLDVEHLKAQILQGKVARVIPTQDANGRPQMEAFNQQGASLGVVPGGLPPAAYLPKATDTTTYMQDADGNIQALPKHTSTHLSGVGAPSPAAPVPVAAAPSVVPAAAPPPTGSAPSAPHPASGPHAAQVIGADGLPMKGHASTQRLDHSYEINSKALEQVGSPVDQAISRMGRLEETLNQKNPQADALIGPELLTIMAGGQGSGLRMTEAEISRVVGGRSAWENLKGKLQHWSLDPDDARTITPDQDRMIRSLVDAVHSKLQQKQGIINQARQDLINADDVKAHREIVTHAKAAVDSIDAPQGDQQNGGASLQPPKAADPGMKWQHRTASGKTEWRQVQQ